MVEDAVKQIPSAMAFDTDPVKMGSSIHGGTVLPVECLVELAQRMGIHLETGGSFDDAEVWARWRTREKRTEWCLGDSDPAPVEVKIS